MRNRPKGLHVVKKRLADGTIKRHYYHRASRTKIHAEPGSAAFLLAMQAADDEWRGQIGASRSKGTLKEQIAIYNGRRGFL